MQRQAAHRNVWTPSGWCRVHAVHMCRKTCAALASLSLLWVGGCDGERTDRSVAATHDERVRDVAVPMQLYGVDDRDVAVGEDRSQLLIPPGILDSSWLRELSSQQLAAAARLEVFHGFSFQDRLPESGISFQHRIVEDAGRVYKAVHYDHGNGVAVADVDGDLDIVTNDFNSEPMVLMSDLAQRTEIRWLKVTLVGRASNRDGLGARVEVTTDGHTLTSYQSGKSGYLAQSRLPLYFGLGGTQEVRSIDVLWPSGRR